jgi:hypothetical protein
MPVLRSDDTNVGIDQSSGRSHAILNELRVRFFTIGWAAAVLVATTVWLYFIARTAWFLVNWLLG